MKKVLRGICFAGLLTLVVWRAYCVLSWKDTTGGYLSSAQQLYNTEENLIDVLFVGSSHCYCSVYPEYLWANEGIAAFDLAISGQDKLSSYHSVVEALKTQKPKVVMVECYGLLYEGYGQEGNKYRNLMAYKSSENSLALAEAVDGEENKWDYFLKWPIVHTRYRELKQYDFEQYQPSVYGRGSDIGWKVGYGPDLQEPVNCDEIGELSQENLVWLDSLMRLAEENQFRLVFFMAPMEMYGPNQKIVNAAADYVRERGADFVDFGKMSSSLGFVRETDFSDAYHCNGYGAAKVTEFWRQYLLEHYELADHRGDAAYYLWDLDYHYYRRLEKAKQLDDASGNINTYLSMALADTELTVILSLEGSQDTYSEDLAFCVESLGIAGEEYRQGSKWVWQNGELLFSMGGADMQVYLLDLSDTETLRLENRSMKYGDSYVNNVKINREAYGLADNGMTVVLYDNFRKEVIGKKVFQ